jgi:hypothetical protein
MFLHLDRFAALRKKLRLYRARLKKADCPAASRGGFDGMRTQYAERIGVASHDQQVQTRGYWIDNGSFRGSRVFVRHGSILSKSGEGDQSVSSDGNHGRSQRLNRWGSRDKVQPHVLEQVTSDE